MGKADKNLIPLFIAGLALGAVLLLWAASGSAEEMLRRFSVSTAVWLAFCFCFSLAGRTAHLEKRFALLALLLGAAYLFVVTPLAVPDELHHYRKSLTLSNYLLGHSDDPLTVPAALLNRTGFVRHKCVSTGYLRVLNDLFARLSPGKTASSELAADGYLLFYLPQTLGVTLGRLFGSAMPGVFLTGRLSNLLFYTLCVYAALHRAPRYKTVLGVTALLPMALQQAASLSYDCFTNGMAFLFTAELLYAMGGDKPMTGKDVFRLVLTGTLLAPAKAAYVTMLPLVFLVPAERFGGAGKKRLAATALLIVSALTLTAVYLPGILARGPQGPNTLNWEGGHNYTPAFVLSHPGETAKIFARSLLTRVPSWAFTSVGGVLGGTSLILPYWIPLCLLLLAWLSAGEPGISPSGRERWAYLMCAFGTALLYLITMFFTWTSDYRTIIQGVQGRYFLPVFPLIMIAVRRRPKCERDLRQCFPPAMAAANSLCLWLLLQYTLTH